MHLFHLYKVHLQHATPRLGLSGHTASHLRLEVQLSPHQVDLLLNYVASR